MLQKECDEWMPGAHLMTLGSSPCATRSAGLSSKDAAAVDAAASGDDAAASDDDDAFRVEDGRDDGDDSCCRGASGT